MIYNYYLPKPIINIIIEFINDGVFKCLDIKHKNINSKSKLYYYIPYMPPHCNKLCSKCFHKKYKKLENNKCKFKNKYKDKNEEFIFYKNKIINLKTLNNILLKL